VRTEERRAAVLAKLKAAKKPLSGTKLAAELEVSRQIIVGDISILRAQGVEIYATPRGYVLPAEKNEDKILATLVCRHDEAGMEKELLTIVDNGGEVMDVIIEHPVYGALRADLFISCRRDVKDFLAKMDKDHAQPLSLVTGGVHLHTVRFSEEESLTAVRRELRELQILQEDSH